MDLNTIFFIGPQGSGKGTQAKLLAQKLDFFYWEMGGILRGLRNDASELSRKVTELVDRGVLLNDDLLLQVLEQKLNQIPADKGVIFDGVPRRLTQAEFLMNFLRKQGRANFTTLFINIPRQDSIDRLMKRAKIENRPDDTLEKIEFRLKQYEEDTVPVVEFLRGQTNLIELDGRPAIEEVAKEINQALELA